MLRVTRFGLYAPSNKMRFWSVSCLLLLNLLVFRCCNAANITIVLEELHNTFCLQEDRFISGNILICSSNALMTVQLNPKVITEVVGLESQDGYIEDTGVLARFSTVSDILQLNSTATIIVDHSNHCLRRVDRCTKGTGSFAGNCTQSGVLDGNLDGARFNYPYRMVLNEDNIYLVEYREKGLRQISLVSMQVTSLTTESTVFRPSSIIFWKQALYLTIDHAVARYDLTTGHTELIAGTTSLSGDADGPALRAALNDPRSILQKNGKILIADRANGKLKILSIEEKTIETIVSDIPSIQSLAEVYGDILIGVQLTPSNVYKLNGAEMLFPYTSTSAHKSTELTSQTSPSSLPRTEISTSPRASNTDQSTPNVTATATISSHRPSSFRTYTVKQTLLKTTQNYSSIPPETNTASTSDQNITTQPKSFKIMTTHQQSTTTHQQSTLTTHQQSSISLFSMRSLPSQQYETRKSMTTAVSLMKITADEIVTVSSPKRTTYSPVEAAKTISSTNGNTAVTKITVTEMETTSLPQRTNWKSSVQSTEVSSTSTNNPIIKTVKGMTSISAYPADLPSSSDNAEVTSSIIPQAQAQDQTSLTLALLAGVVVVIIIACTIIIIYYMTVRKSNNPHQIHPVDHEAMYDVENCTNDELPPDYTSISSYLVPHSANKKEIDISHIDISKRTAIYHRGTY